jgi:hypothetical protein
MSHRHIIHYSLLRRVELKGSELSLIVRSDSYRLHSRHYSQIIRCDSFDSYGHLERRPCYQRLHLNHPWVAGVELQHLWHHRECPRDRMILIVKREVPRAAILHLKIDPRELLLGVLRQHLHHYLHRLIRLYDEVNESLGSLCPDYYTLHGIPC